MITSSIALWVLGPTVLFMALGLYVAFLGNRMRKVNFRLRPLVDLQADSRSATLVNVMRTSASTAAKTAIEAPQSPSRAQRPQA